MINMTFLTSGSFLLNFLIQTNYFLKDRSRFIRPTHRSSPGQSSPITTVNKVAHQAPFTASLNPYLMSSMTKWQGRSLSRNESFPMSTSKVAWKILRTISTKLNLNRSNTERRQESKLLKMPLKPVLMRQMTRTRTPTTCTTAMEANISKESTGTHSNIKMRVGKQS